MVSRTALVMAMTGDEQHDVPDQDILSGVRAPAGKCAHRVMLTPTARAESRLNTMRLGQAEGQNAAARRQMAKAKQGGGPVRPPV